MAKREHPQVEFWKAILEMFYLVEISKDLTEYNKLDGIKIKNLNKKRQVLYMSTIVNLCASWELFIDALITDSIEWMLKIKTAEKLPNILKNRIALNLLEKREKSIPELEIWKLSDGGWKNLLRDNHTILKNKFNTPKAENVDEFVFKTIGLRNLSSNWKWKNQSNVKTKNKLNNFIKIRGDIAHRISADPINFNTIGEYIDFLFRLSTLSSNVIREYIYTIVGSYPWKEHEFKGLSN